MNMKKFSLKPLGDSCIRKVCKSWFFIGLIMAFCVSACSDDDDNAVTPKFPEKQNIICNGGSTTEFTFEANTNWSLTSSAIWCKFEKDGADEFILSGEAGKQTIKIIVTDEDKKVGKESVAKLELTMGGQTIVIGEITRPIEDYKLKIYDEEDNEIEELEVGYDTYIPFMVEANFRFAATNLPSWVALEGNALVGPINKKVKGGLKIIQDGNIEKYPIEASDDNVITFADESGRGFRSFRLSYKGMTPGTLETSLPSSNKYDWTVSLDGKSFAQSGGTTTGSSTTKFKNRLPFTIKTLNDDFEIIFIEKKQNNNNLRLMNPNDKWMRCERNKGDVSLIVNPLDPNNGVSERVGYVLVFSKPEYESIKNDLEGNIINGTDIVYKYTQTNLLVQFTQKEIKNEETNQYFSASDGIECTPYLGSDANNFKEKYGVKGISEIKQPAAKTTVTASFEVWDVRPYYLDDETEAPTEVISVSGTIMIDAKEAKGKDIFLIVTDEADDKVMLIVRTSNVSGGEESESVFTVTDADLNTIACPIYDEVSFGGSQWIKGNIDGCSDITAFYSIKTSKKSIYIKLNSTDISSFTCRDTENFNVINNDVDLTMEFKKINVWTGDGSSLTLPIFLIISGEDGSKYGLFVSNN